jgi:hypothetical protein
MLVPAGDPAALADAIDKLHSDEILWRSQSATNWQRAHSYRSEILAQLRRDWLTAVVGR